VVFTTPSGVRAVADTISDEALRQFDRKLQRKIRACERALARAVLSGKGCRPEPSVGCGGNDLPEHVLVCRHLARDRCSPHQGERRR